MVQEEDEEVDDEAFLQRQQVASNVLWKRKEQLSRWDTSETNKINADRRGSDHRRVKFQDRDVFLSACVSADEDEVEELLGKGADINTCTVDGLTALHQAVIDGKPSMARFLLDHGANVNEADNEGWTALHAAACCGNLEIVRLLCQRGADIALINSDKDLALDLAEEKNCHDFLTAQHNLQHIVPEQCRDREQQLMMRDCMEWIRTKEFMDRPHLRTGAYALHVAAAKGYSQLLQSLIRAGADVKCRDRDGWTPLHAAAHWGSREECRILMQNGARLSDTTFSGQTVLAVADKEIVSYLEELAKRNESSSPPIETTTTVETNVPSIVSANNKVVDSGILHLSTMNKHNVTKKDEQEERDVLLHSLKPVEMKEDVAEENEEEEDEEEEAEDEEEEAEEEEEDEEEGEEEQETEESPPPVTSSAPIQAVFIAPTIPDRANSASSSASVVSVTRSSEAERPISAVSSRSGSASISAVVRLPWQHDGRVAPNASSESSSSPSPSLSVRDSASKFVERSASASGEFASLGLSWPPPSHQIAAVRLPSSYAATSRPLFVSSPKLSVGPLSAVVSSTFQARSQPTPPAQLSTREESEAERKANSRRQRESRRSTQAVAPEDIRQATATVGLSSTEQRSHSGTPAWRDPIANHRAASSSSTNSTSSGSVERMISLQTTALDPAHTPSAANLKRRSQATGRIPRRGTGPVNAEDVHSAVSFVTATTTTSTSSSSASPFSTSATFSFKDRSATQALYGRTPVTSAPIAPRMSTTYTSPSPSSINFIDYKALYEAEKVENEKLKRNIFDLESRLHTQNGLANGRTRDSLSPTSKSSSVSSSEEQQRRSYERKIAELQEEMQALDSLRADNRRLKEENGALIRVISKLSK